MRKFKCSLTLIKNDNAALVTGHVAIPANGFIKRVVYDIPNLAGSAAITTTVSFADKDGHTVHSKASLAENGETDEASLSKPFTTFLLNGTGAPGLTMTVQLSGDNDADAVFNVYVWVDEK